MQKKILIVEDEESLLKLESILLTTKGYLVQGVTTGLAALEAIDEEMPDLVLLDVMLPKMDGFEVCRQIRKDKNVPIIMLTARDEEVERVVGLEIGADDYVVKPFSMRELMARVKSVLRRVNQLQGQSPALLEHGPLRVLPKRHEAYWREVPLRLSPLEFDLLESFVEHPNHVLARDLLLERIWGYDFGGESRVVDTAIRRLRAKLAQADPEAAECITTVRGVGYKLIDG
jgi:DNA-binding response OmpR family regulator